MMRITTDNTKIEYFFCIGLNVKYKFPISIEYNKELKEKYDDQSTVDWESLIFEQLAEYYDWPIDETNVVIANKKIVGVKTSKGVYKLPIAVKFRTGRFINDILPEMAKFYNWEKVEEEANDTK